VTVRDLLSRLPDRERAVVELRFHEDLTQSEIGERIGISQMHVSRLLRRAMSELHTMAVRPPARTEVERPAPGRRLPS